MCGNHTSLYLALPFRGRQSVLYILLCKELPHGTAAVHQSLVRAQITKRPPSSAHAPRRNKFKRKLRIICHVQPEYSCRTSDASLRAVELVGPPTRERFSNEPLWFEHFESAEYAAAFANENEPWRVRVGSKRRKKRELSKISRDCSRTVRALPLPDCSPRNKCSVTQDYHI